LDVVETAAKLRMPKLVPGFAELSLCSDGEPDDTRSTTA